MSSDGLLPLTCLSSASNVAHVVPSSETEWFNKSGLGFFHSSNASRVGGTALGAGIDNDNNLIPPKGRAAARLGQKKADLMALQSGKG